MANITPTASSPVPARPRVEAFLEKHDPPKARVGFGLDATASRQPTWDRAADLTGEMFRAAMSGRTASAVSAPGATPAANAATRRATATLHVQSSRSVVTACDRQ